MLDIFLDSGAFTFFNKGQKVSLKEYHGFVKEHLSLLGGVSSMDVIDSGEKSIKKFHRLRKTGIDYIPCYHYGEPPSVLQEYIKYSEIVSIGGTVPISYAKLLPWLDNLFTKYICDKDRNPIVKTHGFGLTDQRLMFRYPWYSVDSSTWIRVSRMGMLLLPRRVRDKVRWDKQPMRIQVSDKGPMKNGADSHIDIMPKMEKEKVLTIIKDKGFKLGKTVNEKVVEVGLCNSFALRDKFNMLYMLELESNLPEYPYKLNIKHQKVFI